MDPINYGTKAIGDYPYDAAPASGPPRTPPEDIDKLVEAEVRFTRRWIAYWKEHERKIRQPKV